MNPNPLEFRTGVIKPLECIKEGWALIKDQYWLFFGISLVGVLIGGLFPVVLMGPMMVGVFLCLLRRQRGEPVEFGMLFKGFDYFVNGLVAGLLKMLPIMILMVPYYIFLVAMMLPNMLRHDRPGREESQRFMLSFFGFEMIFILVLLIVSMVVEIFFMFAFPLVADRKLSGLDAVKLSIKAGKANAGGILGLILLNGLFSIIGVLCCIVGVYFYLPVAFAAQAVAYRRVFADIPGFASPPPPPPPGSWAA
ncbi:MAG TPA: hypothetical protein VIU65_04930 [Pyrinomonadaceae bacterium]